MRLLARTCEDETLFKNISIQDYEAPRPIKFLAEISLKVANAKRCTKDQERKIWFGH